VNLTKKRMAVGMKNLIPPFSDLAHFIAHLMMPAKANGRVMKTIKVSARADNWI
jgi:hypothetical protein